MSWAVSTHLSLAILSTPNILPIVFTILKELPTGEKYLVDIEIIEDADGFATAIKDTIICRKDKN
jgi:hypothetical protein